jgi:hypothetical protein
VLACPHLRHQAVSLFDDQQVAEAFGLSRDAPVLPLI